MNEADKVGEIKELREQINNLSAQGNKTSYWTKLDKLSQNLSSDQQRYLNNSEAVNNAKSQMVEAFSLFLFKNFREQFAQSNEFRNYCERYIYSIEEEINNYGKNISKIMEENEKLKQEISQIKKERYFIND